MAKSSQPNVRNSYLVGSEDGYLQVLAFEQRKAADYGVFKQVSIERYAISNTPKAHNVTAVVRVPYAQDENQAEWNAKLFVKGLHASVWKESVVCTQDEQGFLVYVKWTIWKSEAEQAEG